MPRRRPLAAALGLALATPLLLLAPSASAAPVSTAKPYDFDGDGFADLAVGVPSLDVGPVSEAGGVVVLPSSSAGLVLKKQIITQATAGVPGDPEDRDYFGSSVASGDLDRDGYADLVVGYSPLTILFGSKQGLTGARATTLAEGATSTGALVTADFDGDGWLDLAAGQPGDERVQVYRGGPGGFSLSRSSVVRGKAGSDVGFGSALGTGDLDGDGTADLVVGSDGPGYPDDEGFSGPGSVSACYGGTQGLNACTQLVHAPRYAGNQSLTVGNVTGDARPEIVFGVPYPGLNFASTATDQKKQRGGAVEVLTLTGTGSATRAEVTDLVQDSKGVRGTGENGDEFGFSIALGDLDRDGFADLVVGAPGEGAGKLDSAGRVTVVYGGKKGYRTSGGKVYDQGTKGVPGKPEERDRFGYAITLLDRDGDGRPDLSVGAPEENIDDDDAGTGAVSTLKGSGQSFTAKGSQTFTLQDLGYTQTSTEDFGRVLGR